MAARAKAHLRHEAHLYETLSLPTGSVEIWRSARRKPSKIAPFYISADGDVFRTNSSWSAFERLLKASRPELRQTDLLKRLIRLAPGRRVLATHDYEVPAVYRSAEWRPRRADDGAWIAHCVETISGRWERLVVGSDYSVKVEDLGPAPKVYIR